MTSHVITARLNEYSRFLPPFANLVEFNGTLLADFILPQKTKCGMLFGYEQIYERYRKRGRTALTCLKWDRFSSTNCSKIVSSFWISTSRSKRHSASLLGLT